MKILYHHRTISKDGQNVHIEEIIKSFKKLGHEVIRVEPSASPPPKETNKKSLKEKLPQFLYEILEFLYSFLVLFKLWKTQRNEKCDFIYERYNLFLPAGIWASKLFKIPLILEVNAPLYKERLKHDGIALKGLARWTEDYCWQNATLVLPVTKVLKSMIAERGVPAHKMHVIHNGINLDEFKPTPPKGKNAKDITLGFIGFVRDWHGLDRLFPLLEENKNYKLLLVGDGPDIPRLKNLAHQKNISDQISFHGFAKRTEIPKLLEKFDIALQPSVVPYASPLKIFEYLAKGCAIVAPDQNNIREILTDHKNALLFKADDQNDFFAKINELVHDAKLRHKLQ